MDAKELRIGNYVKAFDGVASIGWPEVGKKFQIDLCVFELLSNEDNGYSMQFIEPIPLTEQWLLDFGFKLSINKDSGCGHAILGEFNIWADNGKLIYWKVKGSVDLKHVHQLQNLYFALTGKELIKQQ